MPASVARYTFRLSWKVLRSVDARGSAVANFWSANWSGVCEDLEKSTSENVAPPEETSGTPEMVLAELLQVTALWTEVTTSATSAGSAVLPTTKQALACRVAMSVMGSAVVAERMLKKANAKEVLWRISGEGIQLKVEIVFPRIEGLLEVIDARTTDYALERRVADDGQISAVMRSGFVAA
jgi:hypothetical protein